MPMCDAYIPNGSLSPAAEKKLIATLTEVLVHHEMRRMSDPAQDAQAAEKSRKRAASIAWVFVHKTETYVGGEPVEAPHYKFAVTIPEGTLDDVFTVAINKDIFAALVEAEGGKWPTPERRMWLLIHEAPDGTWGSGGQTFPLRRIVNFVSPGYENFAASRFAEKRRDTASALVALANEPETKP